MGFEKFGDLSKRHGLGGGGWFKLQDGPNKVRILEGPEPMAKYFSNGVSIIKNEFNAPDQLDGIKKSIRFVCWVWDKKNNAVSLAEFPYSVVRGIFDLANNDDWGFTTLPDYDLTITKTGQAMLTKYAIAPSPKNGPVPEEIMKQVTMPSAEVVANMIKKSEDQYGESAMRSVSNDEDLPDFLADDKPF